MTKSKQNKPARMSTVKIPARKTSPATGRKRTGSKAPRIVPSIKGRSMPPTSAEPSLAALAALAADMASVKARLCGAPEAAMPGSDEEYDALRRTVNDLLERRMERVVRELVDIRNAACAVPGGEAVLEALEALLERLGAVRFDAQPLDHVDPLIHAVSRETRDPALAEGVIAASLRSGFRTARGAILARAQVAVNRRN